MRNCLLVIVSLLTFFCCLPANAQEPLAPIKPDGSDLITPMNAQPLSIETIARRRGLLADTPARNLIIFCTSGFTGASAAFRDATGRREAYPWQGFQIILPIWADRHTASGNNIILTMTKIGKRLAMLSDNDFLLPGLVSGNDAAQAPDLSAFSMALSLSGRSKEEERKALMAAVADTPGTTDLAGLETLFTRKSQKITACLSLDENSRPGFSELLSAVVSRISLAPEGFALFVNLSMVSRHRESGNFSAMLDSMRLREHALTQLETFTAGRKDTLLLIVDEPENGLWTVTERFRAADFTSTVRKLPMLFTELSRPSGNLEQLLSTYCPDMVFPVNQIRAALDNHETKQVRNLIEKAVSEHFGVSFQPNSTSYSAQGHTVLALGQNADLFFGVSSFPEFFRRLGLALGLESSPK